MVSVASLRFPVEALLSGAKPVALNVRLLFGGRAE
jgi:hypothetical protein